MVWVGERPTGWDGHLALVYDSEELRRAGVAAWVRRGLDLAAKILYIEPAHESADRGLVGVLKENGVDVEAALERGQLEVFSADEDVYRPDWQASVVEEALAAGYGSVRWSGEATTAWSVMSPSAHAGTEQEADELCRSGAVSILCQYPAAVTPATWQSAFKTHAGGLTDAVLWVRQAVGGVALTGEVDASNARTLTAALLAIVAWAAGTELVLDLAGLTFMDLAGARALLGGTAAYRMGGGRVRIREPQRQVATVLTAVGVDGSCRIEGAS